MGRMLANSLVLCLLIGSILQCSLCDDSNSKATDTDASNEDNYASNEDTNVINEASETNDTGYGIPKKGCGSKKGAEDDDQNQDDCNTDQDTSFTVVENVHQYQESVTLDPKTAHPVLYLSDDLKSVRFNSSKQDLDNNTERFDSDPCVLGAIGFTSGKHFFKASGDGGFLVGYAALSVTRKGPLVLSTDAGIFAYPRAMGDSPDIVGSLLDCDQKQVLFYDESNNEVISNLPMPNGCSEEIRPFVFLGAGELIVS
ncbi:butyrophilin subfamily 1 member A1-like [Lissotriton helveticus]